MFDASDNAVNPDQFVQALPDRRKHFRIAPDEKVLW